MAVIKRYTGDGEAHSWEGVEVQRYGDGASLGATVQRLIGRQEEAPTFALRYFEIQPGGYSVLESHAYEHGVVIFRGSGTVLLDGKEHPVRTGDVVYIRGWERHQFRNPGPDVLGFLCIVPANRPRSPHSVD